MAPLVIRPYRTEDRSRVRQIAWDTALLGDPASRFFESETFLEDLLTGYFTDYEPESCFVAETGDTVVGYLLGCCDSRRLDRVSMRCIAPRLLAQLTCGNVLLSRKNLLFGSHMLTSLVRGELSAPDFSRVYPATLHINLAGGFRRCGAGSQLIAAFTAYLKERRIAGVRLATYSEDAGVFFRTNGFALQFQRPRTYFRYILNRDINVYIYAKKINGTPPRHIDTVS